MQQSLPMKRLSHALIRPVVVPKAADVLAERLRNLIVEGHFSPGDLLPTERELVVEAGLSRTSVRDALRVLESEGLISTKAGRTGGSMVTLPGRQSVARSVELFVRTHGIRLDSLLECRVAVEPTPARLAALKRTEAREGRLNRDAAFEQRIQPDTVRAHKQLDRARHGCASRQRHHRAAGTPGLGGNQ